MIDNTEDREINAAQKHLYNKIMCVIAMLISAIVFLLFIYIIVYITIKSGLIKGLIFSPFAIIFLGILIYISKNFFLPAISGKVALMLDSKRITDNIGHKTIEWKQVKNVETRSGRYDYIIVLKLFDKSEVLISTRYIKGDHNVINEEITRYWHKNV